MHQAVTCYREFAPCEALREHVRALFSFVPCTETAAQRPVTRVVRFGEREPFFSPLFADGHLSMVFSLGRVCHSDGSWSGNPLAPCGHAIGAMSAVGPSSGGERPEMIGAYFRPTRISAFTHVPACALTDRIVALDDLWGAAGAELAAKLCERNEAGRIECLESALLARIERRRAPGGGLDVPGLAAWVLRCRGRIGVRRLAEAAGVSRQRLTQVFRECIGVTPKLYCRLARFQSGLAYAGRGKNVDWAQAALDMGYADQSHMIAEFREFTSLTPQMLATQQWFHPFIERAREARQARQAIPDSH